MVKQLEPGDLIALFYRNRVEQLNFLIPYLKHGLAANQRCLYIADDIPVRMILEKLEAAGVDVATAQRNGALNVLTKSETYFRDGPFSPLKMLSDLRTEVQSSLEKGFAAFRGSGDMGWALESRENLRLMIEYQHRLFDNFPDRFLAVCQYDETRFSSEVLDEIALLHNAVIKNNSLIRHSVDEASIAAHASEHVRLMLRAGMSQKDVLARLATLAERLSGNGAVASILFLDENGLLRNAASPSLPADYLQAIDGLKPHADVGTCASAAATGNVVVTRDFFADEKWSELRHLPSALGFVGAWSMPIKDHSGKVLGTFGTYFRDEREPSEKETEAVAHLAEAAAHVLSGA